MEDKVVKNVVKRENLFDYSYEVINMLRFFCILKKNQEKCKCLNVEVEKIVENKDFFLN